MVERCEASFITTTSYGSWLPGDVRGYVENGELLPSTPPLVLYAAGRLKSQPVLFSDDDGDALHDAIVAAADEFSYRLSDLVVETTHLHYLDDRVLREGDPRSERIARCAELFGAASRIENARRRDGATPVNASAF